MSPASSAPFLQRQGFGGFAEIALRRHLDAPRGAAEIDGVEIDLEDFRLGERPLQARGDDHLAHLALVGHVVADEQVLGHLLGDGGAALRPSGLGEVADEGADDAALVDAFVLMEALVLGGDESLLHMLGDVGERHPDAAVVGFVDFAEALAVAVEDGADARQPQPFQFRVVGQIGDGRVVVGDDGAEIDGRARDRLALAELPVDEVQLAEVDALQDLDLAGHGLRVLHGGGDEVVEVDVLDVEGAPHMRAAVLEHLRDRGSVARRVERGLHRLRAGGDLAEREGGGKDLDENGAHSNGAPGSLKISGAPRYGAQLPE